MALDPVLVALLRCPETMQPLAPAPAEVLQRLGLTEGLLRADGRLVFPVREGIPILLPEEALPVGE